MVQHIIFWLFLIALEMLTLLERVEVENYVLHIASILLRYVGVAIIIYTNLQFLVPKYITKRINTGYYIFLVLVNVIGITLLFHFLIHTILELPYTIIPRSNTTEWSVVTYCIRAFILVLITTLIHFTKEWIKLKDVKIELQDMEKEKLSAELKALKGQINPHFLFNTLNNIYSLSLDKSDKSPELILRLSDLMSYILYEGKEEFISLKKEVEFIDNYIGLEKVRVENQIDISFDQKVNFIGKSIAPLLFVPLVENAFKYVARIENKKAFIHISIKEEDNKIFFISENSYEERPYDINKKHQGIGIENVKKRLGFIYPNKHDFRITLDNNIYKVNLSIDLS